MLSRRTIVTYLLITYSIAASSQEENGLVKWLTLKEAQEKNTLSPKPFLIDIYTDWCGWCKHMMRTTYSNPALASYINTHFYPVKFNAETKDTIEYNGVTYKPLSANPKTPHELAVKFLGQQLSYPSTVFIANNYQFNLLTQGFLDEKKIEPLLVFMTENAWQTSVYDDFSVNFSKTFLDTNFVKGTVKIQPIEKLEQIQKKKPRKVLVLLTADFCNTCKVMDKTSFSDTAVAGYINKYYYFAKLNVGRTDTITFKNQKFHTTMVNGFPLHGLGPYLSANRFSLPALCILDENMNTLDILNFYRSPQTLKPILKFIGTDAYKKQDFNSFMQEYQQGAGGTQKQ